MASAPQSARDLVAMNAVPQQWLRCIAHIMAFREPKPQIVVLARAENWPVAAGRQRDIAAHHHCGMGKPICLHQLLANQGGVTWWLDTTERAAILIDHLRGSSEDHDIGLFPPERHLTFQAFGQCFIVGIHDRNQVGLGTDNAKI
jgi:hypothetical protein